MRPLTITLPPETFIRVCKNKIVKHAHNPRVDRFFAEKRPDRAKVSDKNKTILFEVDNIVMTAAAWEVHLGKIIKYL
jgi:hypothetical protein